MNTGNYQMRPVIEKISSITENAELFSAFSFSDILRLKLHIPKCYRARDVRMIMWVDDFSRDIEYPLTLCEQNKDFDIFNYCFDFEKMCEGSDNGLFYYSFSFVSNGEILYISRNGDDLAPEVIRDRHALSSYQLTVYSDDFTTPDRFKGGIMYQIFTDRFAKSDVDVPCREDAVINGDWYNGIPEYADVPGGFVRNNMFFGGTLWGVIEKLDYLKSLGVTVLYLNPIFEAYSNHKYDTGDYMKVDEMFGGDKALEKLCREAEKRGMDIILDGVFNHTGSDSIYFNRNGRYDTLGAYNSRESKYHDWFYFNNFPDKYESWWGIEVLPKLNGQNPELREYFCGENGVIRHYLKLGIKGWRLDVADELNEEFLAMIRSAAKSENKEALVLGEVWEDASNKVAYDRRRRYFRGYELDSVMNYPLRLAVIDYILSGSADNIARTTTELYRHYPKAVSDVLMNFLGTHDTERILTILGEGDITGKSNFELSTYKLSKEKRALAIERLKLAYLIISTMPGIPCIYYGDEAGLEGARDPFNRRTYPWGMEDSELVDWYKKIGKIRRDESLFADGYFRVLSHENGVLVYERFKGDDRITVIVNLGSENYNVIFENKRVSLIDGVSSADFSLKPGCAQIVK